MPRTEQAIPTELGQDGAEGFADSDGDLTAMDQIHRVRAREIRRIPGGAPLPLDQVGAIRRMEQGRLADGLLREIPHEDLGMALERHGLLFAAQAVPTCSRTRRRGFPSCRQDSTIRTSVRSPGFFLRMNLREE